jgi:hypothetical protein
MARYREPVGYPTPEQAALAEWEAQPLARVRVIKVEYEDDDHAIVIADTVPSHPMRNQCERTNDGWVFTGDHN